MAEFPEVFQQTYVLKALRGPGLEQGVARGGGSGSLAMGAPRVSSRLQQVLFVLDQRGLRLCVWQLGNVRHHLMFEFVNV